MAAETTVTAVIAKAFEKISELLQSQATHYGEIAAALKAAGDDSTSLASAMTALDSVATHAPKKRKQSEKTGEHHPYEYLLFCNDNRELVKQSGVVGRDILARLGAMWNILGAEEKKKYKAKADKLKEAATGATAPAVAAAAPVANELDEDRTESDTDREVQPEPEPEPEPKRKHKHKKKKKHSKHKHDDEE